MGGTLLILALLLVAGPTQAHGLRLLVAEGPDTIGGQVLYAGGSPAAVLDVRLHDGSGAFVARTHTDEDGRFEFSPVPAFEPPLFVEADAGDGHAARAPVRYSARDPGAAAEVPDGSAQLATEIELAVARQIRPLREQIAAWEERRSLRDVLGGLGYIAGLAGVGLFFVSRRKG